jgi:hypothetical protein
MSVDLASSLLEKRLLRRIFEPKREKVTGERKNYIMRRCIVYTLLQMWIV